MSTSKALACQVEALARELGTDWTGQTDENGALRTADGEATTASEWLDDCMDLEFHVIPGPDGLEVRGGEVAVSIGGPNIFVNSSTGEVWGSWGASTARACISPRASSEITDALCEKFECYQQYLH